MGIATRSPASATGPRSWHPSVFRLQQRHCHRQMLASKARQRLRSRKHSLPIATCRIRFGNSRWLRGPCRLSRRRSWYHQWSAIRFRRSRTRCRQASQQPGAASVKIGEKSCIDCKTCWMCPIACCTSSKYVYSAPDPTSFPCQYANAFAISNFTPPLISASAVPSAYLFQLSAVPTRVVGRIALTSFIFSSNSAPVKLPR